MGIRAEPPSATRDEAREIARDGEELPCTAVARGRIYDSMAQGNKVSSNSRYQDSLCRSQSTRRY